MDNLNLRELIDYYSNILGSKDATLSFLLKLKLNAEFNGNVDWKKLCLELGTVFNDHRPYYTAGEFTPDPINPAAMGPNDVFVFGSNTLGHHNGGAAKAAMDDYEAVYGQARGLQGRSYGIVTIDYTGQEPINLDTIKAEVETLVQFALQNGDKTFWLTKIGCGISRYDVKDVAPIFQNLLLPPNVIIPAEFYEVWNYYDTFYDAKRDVYLHKAGENAILIDGRDNSVKMKQASSIPNYFRLSEMEIITKDAFITKLRDTVGIYGELIKL